MTFFQFTFSTVLDKFCIFLASVCTIFSGVIQPYIMIQFGKVTGALVSWAEHYSDSLSDAEKQELNDKMYREVHMFAVVSSVIGFLMIIATYVSVVLFNYATISQVTMNND